MAREEVIVDDLTGDSPATEVTFQVAGRTYKLDLTAENAAKLLSNLEVVDEFLAVARKVRVRRAPEPAPVPTLP